MSSFAKSKITLKNENEFNLERCDFCGGENKKDTLINVMTTGGLQRMCKICRKEHGLETEDDVLEEISKNIKTPQEIVAEFDKYIIGQDEAKRSIAVEVYNHFLRVINKQALEVSDKVIKKNNIILTGPTGTGKTLIAQTLAKILGVPFAIANATTLTETGYVGNDVESIFSILLKDANMNPNRAQFGIIFIDEVDKLAKKAENMSITRDVSGEGVQKGLLKMLEDTIVGVPENGGRIHPNQKLIDLDTKNILFIAGGAFEGIEEITKNRLNIGNKDLIGFNVNKNTSISKEDEDRTFLRANINESDLLKFGFCPEFLGRFPVIENLMPLTVEQLVQIMNAKHGLIEEYTTLFELQKKKLHFAPKSLEHISKLAINKGLGARALRGIVSAYMKDMMFYAPSEDKTEYIIKEEDLIKFFREEIKTA